MGTRRFAAALSWTVALVSCAAQPVAPTGPAESPLPNFIVTTGMNVVAEGSQTELTTTAFTRVSDPNAYVLGVPQSEVVSSTTQLQAASPDVALASGTRILGRSQGATTIRASHRGREYDLPLVVVRPSASAQSFAGTWRGVGMRFCEDVVGNTRSCRDSSGELVVRAIDVLMTLADAAGVLTGRFELGGTGSFSLLSGPALAGVDQEGRLVVGGFVGQPDHSGNTQLFGWRFHWSGTQLAGTGMTERGFVNIYGPVLQRVTFTSLTLTRQQE